jgi:hypothetical protein
MIFRSQEEWEEFCNWKVLPYKAMGGCYGPQKFPCFMKDEPTFTWDNPNGPYEQYYEFFYLDEAKEFLEDIKEVSEEL